MEFILNLDYLISTFSIDSRNTYVNILKEELDHNLMIKLGCPTNKIEIILYNIVPFIEYNYNLNFNWLLLLEIKFIILKILKKNKINIKEIKNKIIGELYETYIKIGLLPKDLVQNIIFQLFYRIKV